MDQIIWKENYLGYDMKKTKWNALEQLSKYKLLLKSNWIVSFK